MEGWLRRAPSTAAGRNGGSSSTWRDKFGEFKPVLALLIVSGLTAAAIVLHRRQRRQDATPSISRSPIDPQQVCDDSTTDLPQWHNEPRRHSEPRPCSDPQGRHPVRPPGFVKNASLSDTYACNAQGVDIGAVLGVDIGGTLSKLVYFEKKAPSKAESRRRRSEDPMGKKVSRVTCYGIPASYTHMRS